MYECSPADGCVKVNVTPGLWWHSEHWPLKPLDACCAGGVWQLWQFAELPGCVNAQDSPGFVWQRVHGLAVAAGGLCCAGTAWQSVHVADLLGCVNDHDLPGCVWQRVQGVRSPLAGLKCLADGAWHCEQSALAPG